MSKVAVVGSRKGVNPERVLDFLQALRSAEPETVVISGGAIGVDSLAERTWIDMGGAVISFRPLPVQDGSWGVHKLGFGQPFRSPYSTAFSERILIPTWADKTSALFYRNWLIVEEAEKVVSFHAHHSSGTAFTKALARDMNRPLYEMEWE